MNANRVGYLGPVGSYSHLAALNMCGGAQLVAHHSFQGVISALLEGSEDAAVLPIENTINGGVLQNMDLLARHEELSAVAEYTLCIDHRLITLACADFKKITRIFSHGQALDQCAVYLRSHYPHAELVPVSSTAAGVECIQLPTDAAIAGAHNIREGLTASTFRISDEPNNFTHFLLVVKGGFPTGFRSRKLYFSLTCRHEPGALMRLLEIIYRFEVNMTKIESRPIKDRPGEYRFFIEVEADYSQPSAQSLISSLKGAASSFRLIGCY